MHTNEIKTAADVTPHKFEDIDGWNESLREILYFTAEEVGQIIERALDSRSDDRLHWRWKAAHLRGTLKGKTLAEVLFPEPVPVNKEGMTILDMEAHIRSLG